MNMVKTLTPLAETTIHRFFLLEIGLQLLRVFTHGAETVNIGPAPVEAEAPSHEYRAPWRESSLIMIETRINYWESASRITADTP